MIQDLAGVLNDSLSALGDVKQPVSINQNIYSTLLNSYINLGDIRTLANTYYPLMNTDLDAIRVATEGIRNDSLSTSFSTTFSFAVAAAGVFTNTGFAFPLNTMLLWIQVSARVTSGVVIPGVIDIWFGTPGAAIQPLYTLSQDRHTVVGPLMGFSSSMLSGGYAIPNGVQNLWLRVPTPNTTVIFNAGTA
jgi:hypothetical protein